MLPVLTRPQRLQRRPPPFLRRLALLFLALLVLVLLALLQVPAGCLLCPRQRWETASRFSRLGKSRSFAATCKSWRSARPLCGVTCAPPSRSPRRAATLSSQWQSLALAVLVVLVVLPALMMTPPSPLFGVQRARRGNALRWCCSPLQWATSRCSAAAAAAAGVVAARDTWRCPPQYGSCCASCARWRAQQPRCGPSWKRLRTSHLSLPVLVLVLAFVLVLVMLVVLVVLMSVLLLLVAVVLVGLVVVLVVLVAVVVVVVVVVVVAALAWAQRAHWASTSAFAASTLEEALPPRDRSPLVARTVDWRSCVGDTGQHRQVLTWGRAAQVLAIAWRCCFSACNLLLPAGVRSQAAAVTGVRVRLNELNDPRRKKQEATCSCMLLHEHSCEGCTFPIAHECLHSIRLGDDRRRIAHRYSTVHTRYVHVYVHVCVPWYTCTGTVRTCVRTLLPGVLYWFVSAPRRSERCLLSQRRFLLRSSSSVATRRPHVAAVVVASY
jgi:hypothetical protein